MNSTQVGARISSLMQADYRSQAVRAGSLKELGDIGAAGGSAYYCPSPNLMISNYDGDLEVLQIRPDEAVVVCTRLPEGEIEANRHTMTRGDNHFILTHDLLSAMPVQASLGVASAAVCGPHISAVASLMEDAYKATFPNGPTHGSESISIKPARFGPAAGQSRTLAVEHRNTSNGASVRTFLDVSGNVKSILECDPFGNVDICDSTGYTYRDTKFSPEGEMQSETQLADD